MTLVVVAYRTEAIDAAWAGGDAEVVVVHNDDRPVAVDGGNVRHLQSGANVGFGGGVNVALPEVTTERLVLCNPDVQLTPAHWRALMDATADEVVTIPLVDSEGRPTSVVNRYPTPLAHLLGGWRVGRWLPRGGRGRRLLAPLLGGWGREHDQSLARPVGTWPLATHWVSGAVVSVDTSRLRAVGGFDPHYFLYYEDTDLSRRLADAFPDMVVRVADVVPGVHAVGGSGTSATAGYRRTSAVRYAATQPGVAWRLVAALLGRGRRA